MRMVTYLPADGPYGEWRIQTLYPDCEPGLSEFAVESWERMTDGGLKILEFHRNSTGKAWFMMWGMSWCFDGVESHPKYRHRFERWND